MHPRARPPNFGQGQRILIDSAAIFVFGKKSQEIDKPQQGPEVVELVWRGPEGRVGGCT